LRARRQREVALLELALRANRRLDVKLHRARLARVNAELASL